jgi:hypothetical protein
VGFKKLFSIVLCNISANSDVWFAWLKKKRFAKGGPPDLQGVALSPVPPRQGERNRLADTGPQAVTIVAGSSHHPVDTRQLARTLVSKSQALHANDVLRAAHSLGLDAKIQRVELDAWAPRLSFALLENIEFIDRSGKAFEVR